ncbi:ankyrin repeat domain-containing protein [Alteromonas stellipolaris]|uniref:ankyrin repeat domain-containing protein n=1 Tax=Alteromonas stellipolaris TaxID=233316 RepID=UPI0027348AD8|nr:ankyrin repeat domain-containing protein [Alteromonas stellipolaris]MDP2537271.1 hypothetical protein [Alteromonas stellipolaris]
MKRIVYILFSICVLGCFCYFYIHEDDQIGNTSNEKIKSNLNDAKTYYQEQKVCEKISISADIYDTEILFNNLKLEFKDKKYLADFILYYAGVDIIEGRKKLNLMKGLNHQRPIYYEGIAERAEERKEKAIFSLLLNRNVEEIVNTIIEYELNSYEYYRYKGKYVFLIELILLSDLPQKEKVIREVLSAGIEPTISDLVAATRKGVSVELIDQMLLDSSVNPKIKLNNQFHYRSLATYAIYEKNYDLFKYWLKKGSPPEPDMYVPNSLDILGFRYDEFTQNQVDDVFATLTKEKVYPNVENSYSKLNAIVSDNVLEQNPIPNKKFVDIISFKNFLGEELQLYSKFISSLDYFKEEQPEDNPCLRVYGREIVKNIIEKQKERLKPQSIAKDSVKENFDKKIEKAKSFYSNESDIISYLGGNQTVSDKKLVEYYIRQKAVTELNEAINNTSPDLDILNLQKQLAEVFELAKKGRWEEARNLLNTLDIEKAEALSTLLVYAVNLKAEVEVIRGLLSDGAYFESAIIYSLIHSGRVNVAEVFQEFGLDINYLGPNNSTPVMVAAQVNQYEMMKWLISKGSKVNSQNFGYDALDTVLLSRMPTRRKIAFISLLLNNGALIETSHKQIIKSTYNSNIDEYFQILVKFPAFSDL